MVTMGVLPFQGKAHMVEPGIEPGISWLVVRNSDQASHEAGVLVKLKILILVFLVTNYLAESTSLRYECIRKH